MGGFGKVVVVGSANVDSTFFMERLPEAGQTVTGARVSEAQGGVGANQALAAARSGAEVELIAAVGNDEIGSALLAGLRQEGVGVARCLYLDEAPTGRASIWVDGTGENRIVVASGANGHLDAAAVTSALAGLAEPAIVLCQLETRAEAAGAALAWARERGAVGILNASPAPAPGALPPVAAMIVVNEGEARAIAAGAGAAADGPEGYAAAIAGASGAETVIVTLGPAGALAHHRGDFIRFTPPAVDAIDTTGAGDAFAGALAARLAVGESLERALTFACVSGALATTLAGAGPAIPDANSVEQILRSI
jgi:ribokinase